MGVPNELLDHGFRLLMVIHEACKAAGLPGRPITEDALEAALVRVGAKFAYLDGETERESWDRSISIDLQCYRETWLLAYTATYLRDHVCFAPGPDEAVSLLFQAALALFHAYTDPAD